MSSGISCAPVLLARLDPVHPPDQAPSDGIQLPLQRGQAVAPSIGVLRQVGEPPMDKGHKPRWRRGGVLVIHWNNRHGGGHLGPERLHSALAAIGQAMIVFTPVRPDPAFQAPDDRSRSPAPRCPWCHPRERPPRPMDRARSPHAPMTGDYTHRARAGIAICFVTSDGVDTALFHPLPRTGFKARTRP